MSVVVPSGLTLLCGGARSGKSSLAVRLGLDFDGPVTFVATATPGDDDMAARIERHRAERPTTWATIESVDLTVPLPDDGLVIIDCLTMWTTAQFLGETTDITQRAELLASAWTSRRGPTIVITNEVGLGVVPTTELGREFRDEHGRVNAIVAAAAQRALFVVAGRVVPLTRIEEYFHD